MCMRVVCIVPYAVCCILSSGGARSGMHVIHMNLRTLWSARPAPVHRLTHITSLCCGCVRPVYTRTLEHTQARIQNERAAPISAAIWHRPLAGISFRTCAVRYEVAPGMWYYICCSVDVCLSRKKNKTHRDTHTNVVFFLRVRFT